MTWDLTGVMEMAYDDGGINSVSLLKSFELST